MDALLWLDFETTGLSPGACTIIECAAFFDVKGHRTFICDTVLSASSTSYEWDPLALEMHQKTGLERLFKESHGPTCAELDEKLSDVVTLFPEKTVMLAGNSIHFDRSFIKYRLPRLDGLLHYRHMDVSCIATFLEKEFGIVREKSEKAHRALADVQHSMALYDKQKALLKSWREPGSIFDDR